MEVDNAAVAYIVLLYNLKYYKTFHFKLGEKVLNRQISNLAAEENT